MSAATLARYERLRAGVATRGGVVARRHLRAGALIRVTGAVGVDLCAVPAAPADCHRCGAVRVDVDALRAQQWLWLSRRWRLARPVIAPGRKKGGGGGGGGGGGAAVLDDPQLRFPVVVPSTFSHDLSRFFANDDFNSTLGAVATFARGQQQQQQQQRSVTFGVSLDASLLFAVADPASPPQPILEDLAEVYHEFIVRDVVGEPVTLGGAPPAPPLPPFVDVGRIAKMCHRSDDDTAAQAARVAAAATMERLSHPAYWRHLKGLLAQYARCGPMGSHGSSDAAERDLSEPSHPPSSTASLSSARLQIGNVNRGVGGGRERSASTSTSTSSGGALSAAPNIELVSVATTDDAPLSSSPPASAPQLFVRVLHDVLPGEELTLHFGREWWAQHLGYQLFALAPLVALQHAQACTSAPANPSSYVAASPSASSDVLRSVRWIEPLLNGNPQRPFPSLAARKPIGRGGVKDPSTAPVLVDLATRRRPSPEVVVQAAVHRSVTHPLTFGRTLEATLLDSTRAAAASRDGSAVPIRKIRELLLSSLVAERLEEKQARTPKAP